MLIDQAKANGDPLLLDELLRRYLAGDQSPEAATAIRDLSRMFAGGKAGGEASAVRALLVLANGGDAPSQLLLIAHLSSNSRQSHKLFEALWRGEHTLWAVPIMTSYICSRNVDPEVRAQAAAAFLRYESGVDDETYGKSVLCGLGDSHPDLRVLWSGLLISSERDPNLLLQLVDIAEKDADARVRTNAAAARRRWE